MTHTLKGSIVSFLVVAVALLFFGGLASWMLYNRIDTSNRKDFVLNVTLFAKTLSAEDVSALTGSLGDSTSEHYLRIKKGLSDGLLVDQNIRFTYLMGRNETGELFFYADSEPSGSPEESLPGDVYVEATPAMNKLFDTAQGVAEGPDRDRWGVWISAYAPVVSADGKVLALVGMDVPADNYIFDIVVYSLFPILVAILIILVLYVVRRTQGKRDYY